MVVNYKTYGRGEVLEDPFQLNDVRKVSTKEDEGVVGKLEHNRWGIVDDRVEKSPIAEGIMDKAPENVGDDYEDRAREGHVVAAPVDTESICPAPH